MQFVAIWVIVVLESLAVWWSSGLYQPGPHGLFIAYDTGSTFTAESVVSRSLYLHYKLNSHPYISIHISVLISKCRQNTRQIITIWLAGILLIVLWKHQAHIAPFILLIFCWTCGSLYLGQATATVFSSYLGKATASAFTRVKLQPPFLAFTWVRLQPRFSAFTWVRLPRFWAFTWVRLQPRSWIC